MGEVMESAGEEDLAVSISAVGAVAYICCTVTFVLLVCLLFFLGLTPTQRYARAMAPRSTIARKYARAVVSRSTTVQHCSNYKKQPH